PQGNAVRRQIKIEKVGFHAVPLSWPALSSQVGLPDLRSQLARKSGKSDFRGHPLFRPVLPQDVDARHRAGHDEATEAWLAA
ncbi:MAG: hypothetical protein WB503_16990, partial [Pseudolabrys sp.]